jgi:hypothetical protein
LKSVEQKNAGISVAVSIPAGARTVIGIPTVVSVMPLVAGWLLYVTGFLTDFCGSVTGDKHDVP